MEELMEDYVIGEALPGDIDGIFTLLTQLWPDEKLNKENISRVYSDSMDNPDYFFLIAKDSGGKIIALAAYMLVHSLWQSGLLCQLNELVVDEKYRGKGIGTRLIDLIARFSAERGCSRLELDSAFFRHDAHEFYKSLGFENRAFLFSKKITVLSRHAVRS
jgi:GNAT superfamily N-acetyltransferase